MVSWVFVGIGSLVGNQGFVGKRGFCGHQGIRGHWRFFLISTLLRVYRVLFFPLFFWRKCHVVLVEIGGQAKRALRSEEWIFK